VTDAVAQDEALRGELREWLGGELGQADAVVVKDPRIGWFLPLWEKAATELGVDVSFASLLRHPAEAVSSAIKWYGDWQSPASRTLSWVNIMLETEYATRDSRRVFVRYDDLLADWSGEMARVGATLDIPVLREIPDEVRRQVDAFVDPTLHRNRTTWADLDVPAPVCALADRVWEHVRAEDQAALDADRDAYARLYADAEAIAQCSVIAARGRRKQPGAPKAPATPPTLRVRLARRIPAPYRRRLRKIVGRS
jgi:hypothetical protein